MRICINYIVRILQLTRGQTAHHLNHLKYRMARAIKYLKVIRLKEELDRKFDEWRKRLLDVQKQSIRSAEERVVAALEKRRENLMSEMKHRKEKHEQTFQKVMEIEHNKLEDNKKTIMLKNEKAQKFKQEQEKALERSRALARKTAELRDAIR